MYLDFFEFFSYNKYKEINYLKRMLSAWNCIIENDEIILKMLEESSSIYDQALYFMRQKYFETKNQGKIKTYSYPDLWNLTKVSNAVIESKIDINVKQYIVKQVCSNWKAYIKACHEYKIHPEKFEAAPKIPNYLSHKNNNRKKKHSYNLIQIDKTRFKSKDLESNTFKIPCSDVLIKIPKQINLNSVRQVTIQKFYGKIKVNIIFNDNKITSNKLDQNSAMGIDIGVNNFCAVTINDKPFSYVIDGRPLKSINQFYNKTKAEKQSKLEKCNKKKTSNATEKLDEKRNLKIRHYMHNVSKMIINLALRHSVSTIYIGHNIGWKQDSNMGKKNNQNFVSIPFNMLIDQIKNKSEKQGIKVEIVEESYTSKVDHLALETLEHHDKYLGSRIKRGLFKSSVGITLNADINGAIGILRKGNAIGMEQLADLSNRGDVVSPTRCHVHY
ncbi:MAG: transposase [Wendovervirus sonii]|uniref:Transposase n=1 Tax=phage Lak_Megaphage_Sonny TaxID=3109229 RepID=A0ABZ0Z5B3_9CAUD|nr:MAG: transposase [phage Lak_Megaphage_Sonny]